MRREERTEAGQDGLHADKLLGLLDLLVIDDDAMQRMLIAGAAEKAGYAVTHAASCAEGIGLIRDKHFDCITLDLKLEDGDGADVMRALYYIVEQSYETGQALPVAGGQVMLSS